MNKKCPSCGSRTTKRNGTRNGRQLYKCMACGHQFRAGDTMTNKEPQAQGCRSLEEAYGQARHAEAGRVRKGVRPMEGGLGAHAQPPDDKQADKQVTLHPQASSDCHEQRGILPASSLHLSGEVLRRDAKHEQQDRGRVHRPEEEPEQPQRDGRGRAKEIHQWVFLGIGGQSSISQRQGRTLNEGCGLRLAVMSHSLFLTGVAPQQSPATLRLRGKDSDLEQTPDTKPQIFSLPNDPLDYNSFSRTYTPTTMR